MVGLLTARVVGSFAGDGDIVRVTFLHTGVRDAGEFGVVQSLNGGSTTVAHARAKPAHELVDHLLHTMASREPMPR